MKKVFLFSLLLLYFSLTIKSQDNHDIDSTSKWIQEEILGGTSDWAERNYSLSFQGDTIINDTAFLKMFLNGKSQYWDHGGSLITILSNLYFGAVNVDSGKIFFVAPDSTYSIPLYDFNYNVNDTIKTIMGNGLIIIDIDTIMDGRKKYKTNSEDQFYIVEGIGSNHGFYFAYFLYQLEAIVDTTLGCYYQDASLVFLNDSVACYFSLPVDIYENLKENKPTIYPNPAEDFIRVEINEPIEEIGVYDIYGSKYLLDITPLNQIIVTTLPDGCYFLNINNKHTIKFIKK